MRLSNGGLRTFWFAWALVSFACGVIVTWWVAPIVMAIPLAVEFAGLWLDHSFVLRIVQERFFYVGMIRPRGLWGFVKRWRNRGFNEYELAALFVASEIEARGKQFGADDELIGEADKAKRAGKVLLVQEHIRAEVFTTLVHLHQTVVNAARCTAEIQVERRRIVATA